MKYKRSPWAVALSLLIKLVLLVYLFVVVYPIVWAILMSLKPNAQFFQDIWGLPKAWAFDNYARAWQASNLGSYFFNSVFVTVATNVLLLATCIPISYILARFRFKGRGVIKATIVSGLLFPSMTMLIAQYLMLSRVQLLDNFGGLILVYLVVSVPFTVFMLNGFFATIPVELEDAARIDGCGYMRTLWRIMAPMAKPGIIMVTTLNVLSCWNEYSIALTLMRSSSKYTIAIGVTSMMKSQTQYTDWGALFAALVVLMGMSFLIYVLFQKHIAAGATIGAVK